MENEAREHLNLAHYNFNRMAVIDEEGQDPSNNATITDPRSRGQDQLVSANGDRPNIKNMHNTTSGFYPQRFGDRVPTRGDMQSRGGGRAVLPSQGGRRGNSRAENSLGRMQQMQVNQAQAIAKGGTHYGNMFNENQNNLLIENQATQPDSSIVISVMN